MDRLYTYKEVAVILSLKPQTIRSLVHKGHIKKTLIGTRTARISEQDLKAYIRKINKDLR